MLFEHGNGRIADENIILDVEHVSSGDRGHRRCSPDLTQVLGLCGGLCARYRHRETCSSARHGVHVEAMLAQELDDGIDDRQTEPNPFVAITPGVSQLDKRLEHGVPLILGDPYAIDQWD